MPGREHLMPVFGDESQMDAQEEDTVSAGADVVVIRP
jgi:hypothetical protein